jgi:hypothetical protein
MLAWPGHVSSEWGRVKESREKVWLVTCKTMVLSLSHSWDKNFWLISIPTAVWRSTTAFDNFKQSPEYQTYWNGLLSMTLSPPTTVQFNCRSFFFDGHFSAHNGITTVYFPASTSADTREWIEKSIRGLVYNYGIGPGFRHHCAYSSKGSRGWIAETLDWQGQPAIAMRFIDYWLSPKKEAKFRKEEKVCVNVDGEVKLVVDHFMDQLKEAGMLGMEMAHCKFAIVGTFFLQSSA